MNRRLILLSLAGVGIATTGAAQRAGKPDLQAIAHQLVASAMLQEGQSVLISGSVRDAALMEDLAIEARKAGAQPLLSLQSERLFRRSFDEVPRKYDSQEPKLDLADFGFAGQLGGATVTVGGKAVVERGKIKE
jgi:hypothetical protein